ncbi:hypothetical protein [Plantactinospora sp. GCM10030261]|uniref:hypothetical protein n=1 Tax=Plantactinospora sp. GCM10030261 TaxID=3273420 RepID=UPI0036121AEF
MSEPLTLLGNNWEPGETVVITFGALPVAARMPAPPPVRVGPGGAGAMAPAALPARQLPGPLTVTAEPDGTFEASVIIEEVGSVLVTATGAESGTATLVVTVLPRPTQPPTSPPHDGDLPVTGTSLGGPIAVGAIAVVIGALLVLLTVAWRRRGGANSSH